MESRILLGMNQNRLARRRLLKAGGAFSVGAAALALIGLALMTVMPEPPPVTSPNLRINSSRRHAASREGAEALPASLPASRTIASWKTPNTPLTTRSLPTTDL